MVRNPMQTFVLLLGLTLIGCAAFVALDASKLGIGGPDDLTCQGKRRANGPGHWGVRPVAINEPRLIGSGRQRSGDRCSHNILLIPCAEPQPAPSRMRTAEMSSLKELIWLGFESVEPRSEAHLGPMARRQRYGFRLPPCN